MKLRYDPDADALYVRFVEGPRQCHTIRINDRVALDLGPGEELVGIEVLDACESLEGFDRENIRLENLLPARIA